MATAAPAKQPQIVGGCEIIAKIGQGGMGAVYKARQLSLDRIVALKILPPKIALKDPVFIERFLREAKTSAKLNHPHIVQGIDVGKDEQTGYYYFVMEYIDGPTVKELLAKQKVFTERFALEIAKCVAEALACAHRAGIVHRDIKPDNILLTARNEPKLADLGLARFVLDTSLEEQNIAVGTPSYMAPEQVRGETEAIDSRTDLYALGGTLFHMLTGRPPYIGQTSKDIMQMHLTGPVPNARAVQFTVSEEAGSLITLLMQKAPAERMQTAEKVAQYIGEILAGKARVLKTNGQRAAITAGAGKPILRESREAGAAEKAAGHSRARRLGAAVLGAAALAAIVVLSLIFFARPASPNPADSAAAVVGQASRLSTGRQDANPTGAARPQPARDEAKAEWPPFSQACAAAQAKPDDYQNLLRLFKEAEQGAPGARLPEISRERRKVEVAQLAAFQKELEPLQTKAQALAGEKKYAAALVLLSAEHFPSNLMGEEPQKLLSDARAEMEARAAEDYCESSEAALYTELAAAGLALEKLEKLRAKLQPLEEQYGVKAVLDQVEVLRRTIAERVQKSGEETAHQQDLGFKKTFEEAVKAAAGGKLQEAGEVFIQARADPSLAGPYGIKLTQLAADVRVVLDCLEKTSQKLTGLMNKDEKISLRASGISVTGCIVGKAGDNWPAFMVKAEEGEQERKIKVNELDAGDLIRLSGLGGDGPANRQTEALCCFWLRRAGKATEDLLARVNREEGGRFAFYYGWVLMENVRQAYKKSLNAKVSDQEKKDARALWQRLKTECQEAYRVLSLDK